MGNKEAVTKYRETHKEENKAAQARYRELHREEIRTRRRTPEALERNRIQHAAYAAAHRKELNEKQKQYLEANPEARERHKVVARKAWLARYGLTIDEWQDMYDEQCGCCAICGRHQSDLNITLHIDHDHKTNEVRALICKNCNISLGNAFDNPAILRKMAEYLDWYS